MKIISKITFHAIPWVIEDIPAFCKVSIAVLSMYLMVCWSFQLLVTVYFIVVLTTSTFLTSQSVLSSSVSINMVERVWWWLLLWRHLTSYLPRLFWTVISPLQLFSFYRDRPEKVSFTRESLGSLEVSWCLSACHVSCLSLFSTRGLPSVLQHSSIKQSKFQKWWTILQGVTEKKNGICVYSPFDVLTRQTQTRAQSSLPRMWLKPHLIN